MNIYNITAVTPIYDENDNLSISFIKLTNERIIAIPNVNGYLICSFPHLSS